MSEASIHNALQWYGRNSLVTKSYHVLSGIILSRLVEICWATSNDNDYDDSEDLSHVIVHLLKSTRAYNHTF